MPERDVLLRRLTVTSSQPFDDVVGRLTVTIGRPDMAVFHRSLVAASTAAELEAAVAAAVGTSGLMEFARFDAGAVLSTEPARRQARSLRLLVGNPTIMKAMAATVPDAASYAPVTILIDERADGVHLSYDSMASLIAPYGSPSALRVAADLDASIGRLLESAAHGATDAAVPPVHPLVEAVRLSNPPIADLIGFRVEDVGNGRAAASFRSGPQHANPMGTLHGGVLCDVTDAAMGMAFASTLAPDDSFTTIALSINFLRPVWESTLRADARVVHRGRSAGVLECDVRDEDGRLVAKASSTCVVLRGEQTRRAEASPGAQLRTGASQPVRGGI